MKNYAKSSLKAFFRGVCRIVVFPVYVLYLMLYILNPSGKSFQGFSQFFSLLPGKSGEYLRREFYRMTLKSCSKDCCISFGVIFSTHDVVIEKGVYIGPYCIIGHSRIGKNVLISSRVSLLSGIHQHGIDRTDVPITEQSRKYEVIEVEEDCWIGEGAVVGANVRAHSVIAFGSIVINPVLSNSIVAGNPAKLVKKRGA